MARALRSAPPRWVRYSCTSETVPTGAPVAAGVAPGHSSIREPRDPSGRPVTVRVLPRGAPPARSPLPGAGREARRTPGAARPRDRGRRPRGRANSSARWRSPWRRRTQSLAGSAPARGPTRRACARRSPSGTVRGQVSRLTSATPITCRRVIAATRSARRHCPVSRSRVRCGRRAIPTSAIAATASGSACWSSDAKPADHISAPFRPASSRRRSGARHRGAGPVGRADDEQPHLGIPPLSRSWGGPALRGASRSTLRLRDAFCRHGRTGYCAEGSTHAARVTPGRPWRRAPKGLSRDRGPIGWRGGLGNLLVLSRRRSRVIGEACCRPVKTDRFRLGFGGSARASCPVRGP